MMDMPAFMRFAFGGEYAFVRVNQQLVNRDAEGSPREQPLLFGYRIPANHGKGEYRGIDRRCLPNPMENIFGELVQCGAFSHKYVWPVLRNFTPAISQRTCAKRG
jgi:hypothetical protein